MATERSALLGSEPPSQPPPPPYIEHEHVNNPQAGYINSTGSLNDSSYSPSGVAEEEDDDDDDEIKIIPLADSNVRDPRHATSNMSAMMHLLKGNIGTGILAMPSAIMNAGLWVGTVGILLMGIIATHCMHILVRCNHHLCHRLGVETLDYGQVVEQTFKTGPTKSWTMCGTSLATIAIYVLNVFLCITQFGFCIVYILFVAENIMQVVQSQIGEDEGMPKWAYMLIVTGFLIPLVFVRNLRYLAPFSMFANLLTAAGLVIVLYYCLEDMSEWKDRPAFNSWATLPLYFGTAIYAFEGIGVVLPIENKMKTPKDFAGLTGVLNTGMVVVTVLYTVVGFYGYIRAGNDVLGSITLNLPHGKHDWLFLIVKLLFALSIFISYGLQFYVPILVTLPGVQKIFYCLARKMGISEPERFSLTVDYSYRIIWVFITFAFAVSIPHLDLMISLIGALSSSALALIIPPILETVLFWNVPGGLGKYRWYLAKNILICAFGLLGFVAGSVTTIMKIVDCSKHPENCS